MQTKYGTAEGTFQPDATNLYISLLFLHVCSLGLLNSCIFHIICLHFIVIIYSYRVSLIKLFYHYQKSDFLCDFWVFSSSILSLPEFHQGVTFSHLEKLFFTQECMRLSFLQESSNKLLEWGSNNNGCNLLSLTLPKWKKVTRAYSSREKESFSFCYPCCPLHSHYFNTLFCFISPVGRFFPYWEEPIVQGLFFLLNLKAIHKYLEFPWSSLMFSHHFYF